MKKHFKSLISFTLFFSIVFMFSSSCRKDQKCHLQITVLNGTTGSTMGGVLVDVYPAGGNGTLPDQIQQGTTDVAGVAYFTFNLPASLEAKATPLAPYGINTIKVSTEAGKTAKGVIKVY